MAKLKITQVRSVIGRPANQRRIMTALGLHKRESSVIHEDVPSIRGMVFKVKHLVAVEEVN